MLRIKKWIKLLDSNNISFPVREATSSSEKREVRRKKLFAYVASEKFKNNLKPNLMKALILFLAVFLTLRSIGQDFEGKMILKNSYQSKIPNLTSAQLTAMLVQHRIIM